MGYIAVIDTETNWIDQVMSIGTVIAERDSFRMVDARYQVLTPEYEIGGMYEATLFADPKLRPEMCSRPEAISSLKSWFASYDVREIFACLARGSNHILFSHFAEDKSMFDSHDVPTFPYSLFHSSKSSESLVLYESMIFTAGSSKPRTRIAAFFWMPTAKNIFTSSL